MKKIICLLSLLIVFISCKDEKSKKEVIKTTEAKVVETVSKKEAVVAQETSLKQKMADGKASYMQTCFACHQAEGQGIPGAFPPLAKSDYLNADVNRAIDAVLNGQTGTIKVNGTTYNSVMPKQNLSDEEIANVLTYVYNSWGNSKKTVTSTMVKSRR